MNTTAKLLLHCPDQPGILAEVTNFITINRGNIVYLDQYVDHVENIFFMRIEWEIKDFFIPKDKIEDYTEREFIELLGEFTNPTGDLFLGCKTQNGHICFQTVPLPVRYAGTLHCRRMECGNSADYK